MDKKGKNNVIFAVLLVLLVLTAVISIALGRYPIPVRDVIKTFIPLSSAGKIADSVVARIVLDIRLPRVIMACIIGASLSVAGCTYQAVFHNPMASPDILGASSGACFGAALGILLGLPYYAVVLLAFAISLFTIVFVYFINLFAKDRSLVSILLAGIVVGSVFSSATSYIKLVADPGNQLPQISYWLMGSLAGAKKSQTMIALAICAFGMLPLLILRWRMNYLTLPEDEAKSMGVNVRILRGTVVLCATLLTALSVAFAGMIGWVGLAVPHLCRFLVGNNLKKLIPVCMVMGSLFLLVIDDISRNLLSVEIPIGILTAFVGAPFFITLLVTGMKRV